MTFLGRSFAQSCTVIRSIDEQAGPVRARVSSLDDAVDRVTRLRAHLTPIQGIDPSLGVKRVFMRRFPFAVLFIELPDRIRIIAVAHKSRKPFYWRERVND